MNSFRNVQRGLQYEIERQNEVLKNGGRIVQETLLFDPTTGTTSSMRSKEQAHDYRYFPDPDLLPLRVPPELVREYGASFLNWPRRKKSVLSNIGIPSYDAGVLTASRDMAAYFEETVSCFPIRKRQQLDHDGTHERIEGRRSGH